MKLLAGTFALSFASALLPFINIEAYLAVVATQVGAVGLIGIAILAGLGQTLGKLVWYFAALRGMDSKWMQKRLAKPKVKAAHDKWQARAEGRPVFIGVINFSAAFLGVPPMLAMAAVAGSVRMPLPIFLSTCLVGRTLRFYAILAGVSLLWV